MSEQSKNTNELLETYLTPNEVAAALKVTPRAVLEWVRDGRLEAYKPFGRWRITPDQVDRFMKAGLYVPGRTGEDPPPVEATPQPLPAKAGPDYSKHKPARRKRGR